MSPSTTGVARTQPSRFRRWVVIPLAVVALLVLIGYAFNAFVSIDSNLLWFRSVGHESTYTRRFWTELLLFGVFGALMTAAVAHTLVTVHRYRPEFKPDPLRQRWRFRFKRYEPRLRWLLFAVIVAYCGISMGARAAGAWQTWLLWRHAVAFGHSDPQFHRDASYFVFTYPMHRLVVSYLFRILTTCLVVLVVVSYAYGALRLRGDRPRLSPAFRRHLSLLLALFAVVKVFAYWLDRYATVTSSRGVVTGVGYTDAHAILPGRIVLMVVAAITAALLLANVRLDRSRVFWSGIAIMAAGAFGVGVAWPWVVQHFQEKPAASTLELGNISHNITATRQAFGLDNEVTVTPYDGTTQSLHGRKLAAQAARDAQVRLLDPSRMSPTFNVKQQVQGYYGFKSTLDVGRYPVNGKTRDVLIGARELNLSGLPAGRKTWANSHLVYTHGYGLAVAPTDDVSSGGVPKFVEGGLPPRGVLSLSQPRIYFGQNSPSYSIVGAASGHKPQEFDRPSSSGASQPISTTYDGGGGIPVGSVLHRIVFGWKLHSTSLLFSGQINSNSQLLTVRNPRSRVAAVAPWLTLDGDVYPAVVGGRIEWVVDGYTTASTYPDSQLTNLRNATSNTLTSNGSTVTQPSTSVNYMRNSVKAVVDAYTGKVTLYEWDQTAHPDPVLHDWEQAFPGLVLKQSAIPAGLMSQLRYPQDLFNVQRSLLTRYHVTDPEQFYSGGDFWKIPTDPTVAATSRLNAATGKTVTVSPPTQPSVYMSVSADGSSAARYALSTPMVTLNRRNLAAFLSVDSQPGPGYGTFTLLNLPATGSIESPSQIQNDIESTPAISRQLSLARGGNSKIVLGNLLTIPLAGKMLYVEPIYQQSKTGAPYPILRHVVAIYGNGRPGFARTLDGALDKALGVTVPASGS